MADSLNAPRLRALPRINPDNERFFASCREHAMELQSCSACRRFRYYPSPICPYCGSLSFTWARVSGKGSVYSYTWIFRAAPGFEERVPYVYALVELDEGPVMPTNIIGADLTHLAIGCRVSVSYEEVSNHVTLPVFELEDHADSGPPESENGDRERR